MALKYKDIGCIYTFFGWMTVGLYREAAGEYARNYGLSVMCFLHGRLYMRSVLKFNFLCKMNIKAVRKTRISIK